jgi:hypothetical protein
MDSKVQENRLQMFRPTLSPHRAGRAVQATKVREPFVDVEILCECWKLDGCTGSLRRDRVALQILCSGGVCV